MLGRMRLLAGEVLNYQNIYVYYSIMVGKSFMTVILLVHTLVKLLVHMTEQKLKDLLLLANVNLTPYYHNTS